MRFKSLKDMNNIESLKQSYTYDFKYKAAWRKQGIFLKKSANRQQVVKEGRRNEQMKSREGLQQDNHSAMYYCYEHIS